MPGWLQRRQNPDSALPVAADGSLRLPVQAGSAPEPSPAQTLWKALRRPALIGLVLVLLFGGGFGVWAAVAPLAGGAVAPGVISPDGSRRTVQHLEGGIIAEILVKDGDTVAAGDPLIVLQKIQASAAYQTLLGQYRTLLATQARLRAEQLELLELEFPAELREAQDEDLAALLESQRQMFETSQAMHSSRKKILAQRIDQLGEQVKGLEAQVTSASRQLEIIGEELEGKEALLRKELLPKPEVLRLRRAEAEILGNRGEYQASIARARQQIGETEMQLLALDVERADKIATEMDKTRAELARISEQLAASHDILNRTIVAAPVGGQILNLHFKTKGGVIRPGEPILDIVPAEEDLLIDARISPNDIDIVHAGLTAQVVLSAFSNRSTPRIHGRVRSISADRLVDEMTGQPYYLARVSVDRDELDRLGPGHELIPGMPAEVMIVTDERTMFQYLFHPFIEVMRRGMREA